MKASAIIVAAGSGTRLGSDTPKAFIRLGDATLLAHVLRALAAVAAIEEAVIAVPPGMEPTARGEANQARLEIPVKITAGGMERQDSVRIALALTSAEAEIVVVHDAARPFAAPAVFAACIETAERAGGAIAAIPVSDTLKSVEQGHILATLPRSGLWQAQTPQAFRRALLVQAHERAAHERTVATDDANLVERIGATVEVVQGSPLNLKMTTRDDLELAEALARIARR
jgi:2-C-methyl-D-erythritol 4-phosphate cytidylyltransferase